jgi:hypothetical protein
VGADFEVLLGCPGFFSNFVLLQSWAFGRVELYGTKIKVPFVLLSGARQVQYEAIFVFISPLDETFIIIAEQYWFFVSHQEDASGLVKVRVGMFGVRHQFLGSWFAPSISVRFYASRGIRMKAG